MKSNRLFYAIAQSLLLCSAINVYADTLAVPSVPPPLALPSGQTPQPGAKPAQPPSSMPPAALLSDPQNLSIATLLGLNAQYYYNNRFDKIIAMGTDPEKRTPAFEHSILSDFKKMLQLFEKAKTQSTFSALFATRKFGERAIDALTLTIKILEAKSSLPEKQVDAFPQLLTSFMDLFARYKEFSIDLRAEKSLFMNVITDFINNSNSASSETLQKLKTFLLDAPTIAFKENTEQTPFNNKDREKFDAWLPKVEAAIRLAETNQALMALDNKTKYQTSLSWHRARVRRLSSSTSLRPSSSCMR
ncbi:MAG: hypothetical protein WC365_02975 [Candidatus Babeliales bacterium]|jgi:hypothetical protein